MRRSCAALRGTEVVTKLGIPLLPEEEALLTERIRIQSALGPLDVYARDHADEWGGSWLSYPEGASLSHALTVNVGLMSPSEIAVAEIAKLLPEGADLAVHTSRFTEATLDSRHAEILARPDVFEAVGTEFRSVRTELQENRLVISVSKTSPSIERAVLSAFPDGMVRVEEGGEILGDACGRSNCGPPWRAGLLIYRNSWLEYCTANFVNALYLGVWTYTLWTAGHCPSGTWHRGSPNGPVIGSTTVNFFTNGTNIDVQRISIAPGTQDDDYLRGGPNCVTCGQEDVVAKETGGEQVGQMILNSGAISGTEFGTLTHKNVSFTYLGVPLTNMRRATYARALGDSGGPVVRIHNIYYGEYDVAAGLHTHFENLNGTEVAYYTHVSKLESTGYAVYTTGD